ncbi:MAG: hypothetical protein PF503_03310 [Desulfobacula sp.]|jgi:hypothetical protein|nr:hypothetical protein [Desulfobacula sp.]
MSKWKLFVVLAVLSLSQPLRAEEPQIFTYTLSMPDVDTVKDARRYPGKRAALIGFKGPWTATKRLPFKIGPGRVRAYSRQFPEGGDRRQTITIGDQKCEAIVLRGHSQYHAAEYVFDLKEPTDLVTFRAEQADGKPGRKIWYSTTFTNDPNWKYIMRSKNRKGERWSIIYQEAILENSPGNLLPNSGFEEGIAGWDITPYRSGVMVKPSLLNKKAAHGSYSLDVGKMKIYSRWFPLKGKKKYTFGLYLANDNPFNPLIQLEVQEPNGKARKIKDSEYKKRIDSDVEGWKRMTFSFETIPDDQTRNGHYRLVFTEPHIIKEKKKWPKTKGFFDKPVLIDSIQIVEGNDKPYEPYQGVEAGFVSPVTQAIFTVGEPSRIHFNMLKTPDTSIKTFSYKVFDYFDRLVQSEKTLAVEGVHFKKDVPFDTSSAGFYRVRTKVEYARGGKPYSRWGDFFYNVVHPAKPRADRREKSLIGAYYTKAPMGPYSYDETAKKFGFFEFNTLGHSLMRWKSNIARGSTAENFKYDWRNADREIEGFRSKDISIALQFHVNAGGSYGIPKHGEYKEGEFFQFKGEKGKKFSAQLWLDYVTQYAARYKGMFNKYVVQDEPGGYFTHDQYAKFYLATYKAIKEVDPDTPVFFDTHVGGMKYITALNSLTGNKAHEHMDGIHAYLSSKHSGAVSSQAAVGFRKWIRKHNMPLVTVTCFSGAQRYDTKKVERTPDYFDVRNSEALSVHYFLDGVVWGGSRCLYHYYGVHPGKPWGLYLFDERGRVKPMFHFYSAANYVIGALTKTESIDDFPNFRIGIIETESNKGAVVLYSVDGKIYDFSLDAAGITKVLDGFGNPVTGWKKNDKVQYFVSSHPVYLILNDVTAVRETIRNIVFKEKIPIRFTYSMHPAGVLQVKALLTCEDPLKVSTDIQDVFDLRKRRRLVGKETEKGLYTIEMPFIEPAWRSVTRPFNLNFLTNFGDISADYQAKYGAIITTKPGGQDDGKISTDEWPEKLTGRVPLNGYYFKSEEKKNYVRGTACLTIDVKNLRGMVDLKRAVREFNVQMTLIPIDPLTAALIVKKKIEIIIDGDKGTVKAGRPFSFPVARGSTSLEFSIPLARLSNFKAVNGSAYAFNVSSKEPERFKNNVWYLDAAWNGHGSDKPEHWGQLMVVK